MSKPIPELVDEFAKHCLAQRAALDRDDVAVANRHHHRSIAAWHALIDEYGDAGRDGLATLFRHPSTEVRTSAAAFLLRYKTKEATRVLEEAKAAGNFGAEQALERWREGAWSLDPAPTPSTEE
jgi:hypothetical protein